MKELVGCVSIISRVPVPSWTKEEKTRKKGNDGKMKWPMSCLVNVPFPSEEPNPC